MGQSELKQFVSGQRDGRRRRRRRRIESPDGLIASSRGKRKCSPVQQDCVPGGSTGDQANREGSECQLDDSSQSGKTDVYSGPNLPEDMWHHIHSLMPLRDAARAACLSQSFLCSWKRHPNLIFSKETLGLQGLDMYACGLDMYACYKETARDLRTKIDHILRNHCGTGVRKLKLSIVPNYNAKDRDHIDRWLQIAVTPALEELTLTLSMLSGKYKFPCTLLSNGMGDSLRCLYLRDCSFHPSPRLCCLRSLTKLELFMVRIMGDELWSLLSSSSALERLSLKYCSKVSCLKIPCHLQRLSHLEVDDCSKLRVIESKAPNLSRFHFIELASSMPSREVISSPSVSSKYLELKSVDIHLGELPYVRSFDCSSLVSLFGASVSLESFILRVSTELTQYALVFGDCSGIRMSETGYALSPWNKSLVELACHVLRAWLS